MILAGRKIISMSTADSDWLSWHSWRKRNIGCYKGRVRILKIQRSTSKWNEEFQKKESQTKEPTRFFLHRFHCAYFSFEAIKYLFSWHCQRIFFKIMAPKCFIICGFRSITTAKKNKWMSFKLALQLCSGCRKSKRKIMIGMNCSLNGVWDWKFNNKILWCLSAIYFMSAEIKLRAHFHCVRRPKYTAPHK